MKKIAAVFLIIILFICLNVRLLQKKKCVGNLDDYNISMIVYNKLEITSKREIDDPNDCVIKTIYLSNNSKELTYIKKNIKQQYIGKEIYQIEYTSNLQGFLDNLVVYVDKDSLDIIGYQNGRD